MKSEIIDICAVSELPPGGMKLVDENEVVLQGGQRRIAAGEKSRASMLFTTSFTQKYPEISAAVQDMLQSALTGDATVDAAVKTAAGKVAPLLSA